MVDLIDRKRLLNSRVYSIRSGKPNYEKMFKNIVNDIQTAPTVDVEQHAHWIIQYDISGEPIGAVCSNCESEVSYDRNGYFSEIDELYCHKCGYRMNEVEK